MIKKVWLNLPVKSLKKSKEFFHTIGFSFNELHATASSICMLVGENNFVIMLFEETQFANCIQNKVSDANKSTEVLISIDAQSKEEVDEFAVKVLEAGGNLFFKPVENSGWMYGCGFADLDGHRWNVLYMDLTKIPKKDMETLEFNIEIEAPKERVWEVLWNDETYRQWTSGFCEGTYAKSDWNEGSKIHFLTPNGEGMNSIIQSKVINEYMAFKHLSDLKNFEEMPINTASQEWTGAMETYRLTQNNTTTVLDVTMDCIEKYADYFKNTFPKSMEIIKELSEIKKIDYK
jgi:predicted lactoylglutathione lyase